MTYLDLSENQLDLLHLHKGFIRLRYLFLNDNKLESLIFDTYLPQLKTLHLRNNKLEKLPDNFLAYENLETLYLHNNPLSDISPGIVPNDERANALLPVRNYLSSLEKFDSEFLYEAKLILVGNGEVGKSSIRTKLLNKDAALPQKGDRTAGLDIDIAPYKLKEVEPEITKLDKPIDFYFYIWDFGGQGKYREVQQLFCSRKSLYLFVTSYDDDPEDEDYIGFEYWLDMVNSYSYDEEIEQLSPVIHIVNKIDQEELRINEKDRSKLFSNIYAFLKLSSLTLENFPQLEAKIREVLPLLSPDVFKIKFAVPWMKVKEQLIACQNDYYMSYGEYEALCLSYKLNKSEAKTWLETLDRIGTVIYFGDHEELKDWVILNPNWIKNILYLVIDSPLASKGKLSPEALAVIWKDYSEEQHKKFLELMKAYHFCYSQQAAHGIEYVVPACLPAGKPAFPKHLKIPDYQLKCAFDPFIPAGTVNKFMVFLQGAEKGETHRGFIREKELPEVRQMEVSVFRDYMWRNNVIVQALEFRA